MDTMTHCPALHCPQERGVGDTGSQSKQFILRELSQLLISGQAVRLQLHPLYHPVYYHVLKYL